MKLTLAEPKYLKEGISIISDLVNEATLKLTQEGLELVAMVEVPKPKDAGCEPNHKDKSQIHNPTPSLDFGLIIAENLQEEKK